MERAHEEIEVYSVGEQDFKTLREGQYVYVDKTEYIAKIIKRKIKYLFLARPRRFGKSLFLSTLRYFFEGKRELFMGLHINDIQWEWTEYPVLYLDFNTERYSGHTQLESVLENIFSNWEKKYNVLVKDLSYSQRFRNIIEAAHIKTGKQVVILVDEYDKPLVGNLNNAGQLDYFRAQLAAIYSNFKSSAEHIKFVMLTGVSRFSKLSVFSDLNNLDDITFDNDFADICGITERELSVYFPQGMRRLAETLGCSFEEASSELKVNYDGYRFTKTRSDIYNPWSLLCCMRKREIGNYWNQTGKPTIIVEALKERDINLEAILNTECDADMLMGLDLSNMDPLSLLYQTGYLTIKSYDRDTATYLLGIPNREVTRGLMNELLPHYVNTDRESPDSVVASIIRCMKRGEPEKMIEMVNVFLAGIPYEMKMENENNLHNAIYILLRLLGTQVKTEVHTSDGRIDLVAETPKFIYIMELKFDKDSREALSQIESKDYTYPYSLDSRKIFLIGVNFNKKSRKLDPAVIKEVCGTKK